MIIGLISHIIPNGVAILQYTDDTIIFLKHDLDNAIHLKFMLYLFEMLVGLKINFNKSEVFMVNDEENWGKKYAEIFNCQLGVFPIKYLGVPRLKVLDQLPLVKKGGKKLDVWKGGLLSMAGRATLISSSLNNAPIFVTCLFIFSQNYHRKDR